MKFIEVIKLVVSLILFHVKSSNNSNACEGGVGMQQEEKGIRLHQVGDSFEGFLLINQATKGVASNGKPFLTLMMRDVSGEIESKLWGASKEDEETFAQETIVYIQGEITQFRGRNQLKIGTIRLSQLTDGVSVTDFIEKSPVEKEVLKEQLLETIFEIENPALQRIVRAFIKKYDEQLLVYPAATKNHHEYTSGLLHHIVSMLALGKQICLLYPQINKDLLYAGIILHDLGKIRELSGVVSTSYTLEGKLIGHIPMMVEEISQIAQELKIEGEEVLVLQHMILSHHGKAEWGSPKPPLIQEAEILHFIDLIDAKVNMLGRALKNTQPGEFTERLFAMENRSFYKPLFSNE